MGAPIIRDDVTITMPATIADLINFRPTAGITHMQPNGWTIAGMATDFWIESVPEVHYGLLLGEGALVRFTPVSYSLIYGDGSPAVKLERSEVRFDQSAGETPTTLLTHEYALGGRYVIESRVDFEVEYQYDGAAWVTMDGLVSSFSEPLDVDVRSASTVLVSSDCSQKPSAIGC